MEPPFHDAPFFILKKAKNENILINTISISETNKRKRNNLQQMKEPYLTTYTKKYGITENWHLK